MMNKILIVEDEPSIAENLQIALEAHQFQTHRCPTLEQAREVLKAGGIDAMILDIGLPDGSGLDFCKEVRQTHTLPILFLTAHSDDVDRIVGLEIGGDDYMGKPFNPREVVARIKAILRRTQGQAALSATRMQIDSAKRQVKFQGKLLELGRYEFGIIELLTRRPGQIYSRSQIMQAVWEGPEMSLDRTVDAHIKTLRQKISAVDDKCEYLITHRGFGYSWKEQ